MRSARPRAPFRATLLAALMAVAIVVWSNIGNAQAWLKEQHLHSQEYMQQNGRWDVLNVPEQFQVRSIHAIMTGDGKVLMIAGSGNDTGNFQHHDFKSVLWDPALGEGLDSFKQIKTPDDFFCAGQVLLPDGKILIAGGTKRYEILANQVKKPAGVIQINNDSPNVAPLVLPKGTRFVAPNGVAYVSHEAVRVMPARKTKGPGNQTLVQKTVVDVWVTAEVDGPSSLVASPTKFTIQGLSGERATTMYGLSAKIDKSQQDFWGANFSYIFSPRTERYTKISNMVFARWYPTLVPLLSGKVLAVSGLDQFGRIINGDNETFDPHSKRWTLQPSIRRTFPTYPALFTTLDPNKLFYSGSNAGYGSDKIGRTPGIWNLADNSFQNIAGLRDPTETETSASLLLPPAQAQRYAIIGGGGVGDLDTSTSRIDIVNLNERNPQYRAAANLKTGTRYPITVILPNDQTLISNGSNGYRGSGTAEFKHDSDLHDAYLMSPEGELKQVADPQIGRDYHAEGLLLPDGRVLTVGGNPLNDPSGYGTGGFETRLEMYSPPYLYSTNRPDLGAGPDFLQRGMTATFITDQADQIKKVRLIRPGTSTHVTNVEQRSVEVPFTVKGNRITLHVPRQLGVLPSGPYFLFADNFEGVPSVAKMVMVGNSIPRTQVKSLSELHLF